MKAYRATFRKQDGELRTMLYAHLSDLPKSYLPKAKGGKTAKLQEGVKLVWDLENQDYRCLNESTIVGSIEKVDY